jgi:hypothetical protein
VWPNNKDMKGEKEEEDDGRAAAALTPSSLMVPAPRRRRGKSVAPGAASRWWIDGGLGRRRLGGTAAGCDQREDWSVAVGPGGVRGAATLWIWRGDGVDRGLGLNESGVQWIF